jgi:hypothetical protein
MSSDPPITFSIDPDGRGAWDVVISQGREHVTCATLEDAKRLAYRRAADRPPCELIVRDAYHRVIDRELIDSEPDPQGTSGASA